ncbi:MAG: hypothetical protein Q8Q50_02725 [Methylobacter sp.]|nr:hypothetical protein [Methylobacter sp.]
MANKHTTANVNSGKNGHQLSFQQHETDCPILPVPQLEQLQKFKPDAVDWVIKQTQIEAEHRRAENRRVNHYTFIERVLGQIFAFLIGLTGVGFGSYVALHGQPTAGGIIATSALAGLAGVFLSGKSK